MMMNQGGTHDTITTLDPNSLEKYPVVDSSQAYASSYYTTSTGSAVTSWTTHRTDNYSMENGLLSSSSYRHDQNAMPPMRNVQDGLNVAAVPSTSSSGLANVQQDYSNYASYSSNDSCGYNNAGYTGYYNGCQQQTSLPYSQPVGAYQNTGAPYQPLSSFQNTGSYAGPASYSSTYYNPADYQTSGGYPTGSYSSQTNLWHESNYTTYSSHPHPYTNYSTDSNGAYNSNAAAAPSTQYQQHYKQWADYCNQTEASCAPGTENTVVSSAFNLGPSVPGVPGGYSASNNQPSAPFNASWPPEASTESHVYQPAASVGGVHENYWKHGAPVFQNHHVGTQQPNYQKPMDSNSTYENFQEQPKSMHPQGPLVQYPATSQVPQSYPSPLHSVPSVDMRRVSKLQIPTNPRIASNLALGLSKTDKDSSTNNAALKPAYISVSVPKSNDKMSSHDAADSVLKSSTFPKSLRGYVEKALNRCKDDAQKAVCQELMKEVIKKASADGTLFTRDWDTEPLFPLPAADVSKDPVFLTPVSSLSKSKRSPSRRSKSRWEPIAEEKPVDQLSSGIQGSIKYGGRDTLFSGGKTENKENSFNNMKFSLSDQKTTQRNVNRPAKRQRFGDFPTIADNGDASSDSDKEQSLTAYYAGAMALAESPEERKRRENRSKRFEKGSGNRVGNNSRPKNIGPGNLYTRRASAMVPSTNFEEGGSRAVEDIDWDALTVKGTCQEIEKRYLRLTSAPDPTTVRPEEVLKKALDMVRNSQKNYLYKCDQLKSIRQDLTVQHIRNELTVKVYETHARLAIEVGDLPEYNQCQSQLTTLYAEGIKGCHMEFSAYNLLCVILHSNNNRDLLSAMLRLSAEAKKDEAVKHALAVRSAVTSGNYVLFFRLYKTAPNLNTCLMDLYVEKMRYAAVRCMSRSYRPTLPVSYVVQVLGFTSVLSTSEVSDEKDTDGMDECIEWLKAHGACLITDNSGEQLFDTKASTSSLYMPEPEDAVAHGDASLAVNDFLTRNSL